jgi:DNA repair exonuclease SbcCD nuclease subunit
MPETNLLVTGDLHLGIHPSKIPEDLDSEDYSPGAVWQRMVQEACRRSVDAVMITGDIVDRENQFFEAWGPFESGLAKLSEEAIPVFLVAGNHDAGVLESFVDSMDRDNVTLLGAGGEWERSVLRRDGEPVLHVDGWSYPDMSVRENPLNDYDLSDPDTPVAGLLHTDLGTTGTTYAPVDQEDLEQAVPDGWFLGHIHKPRLYSDQPLILNPGAPQPLNPTETGVHGPWLVTVQSSGTMKARQLPLANLEYAQVELDVSELRNTGALAGELKRTLEDRLEGRIPVNEHLDLISVRARLTGRTELYRALDDEEADIKEALRFRVRGADAYVDVLDNQTRPELDLDELSGGSGPVAVLARLLLSLEQEDESELPDELLTTARNTMNEAYNASTYEPLRTHGDVDPPDRREAISVIERQARSLLDTLVAQKEDSS